jgi:hypothetical protein
MFELDMPNYWTASSTMDEYQCQSIEHHSPLVDDHSSKIDASIQMDKDNKPSHPLSSPGISVLRIRFLVGLLAGILLLSLLSPTPTFAARKMLMRAAFNQSQTESGILVSISGRVFETTNTSIPNAVISIQVNNPQGTSIHVAIAYSGLSGTFDDTFSIAPSSPAGNYTAYLVADKPGYDTARLVLTFTYSTPDFSIQSSNASLSVQQGQSGSLVLTFLSLRQFNQPVNLTGLDVPAGVTLRFNPPSIVPSGTVLVSVAASYSAPVGNYTVTLLGVSGSLSHKASFQLNIRAGLIQPANVFFLTIVAVILVAIAYAMLRSRSKRKRRMEAVEELLRSAEADTGYVATARVIARLEELRAMGKVDESTYQRLRKEYEKRLERSK